MVILNIPLYEVSCSLPNYFLLSICWFRFVTSVRRCWTSSPRRWALMIWRELWTSLSLTPSLATSWRPARYWQNTRGWYNLIRGRNLCVTAPICQEYPGTRLKAPPPFFRESILLTLNLVIRCGNLQYEMTPFHTLCFSSI